MPDKHALLSASSAHRWLHCPPSARLCENYEDKGSDYAAEGTDAHSLCEYKLRRALGMEAHDPTEDLSFLNQEMNDCASGYAAYVLEQVEAAQETCPDPVVLIEQRVDFSRWVEQGFGTADCIIIADGILQIIDFKVYVNNHIEKKRIKNKGEVPQYYATETHPAIIDHAIFDAAQEALERIAARHPSSGHIEHYAFTGMILCPACGRHFKRTKNHGLSRWACPTFIQEGKEYCHSRKIPEEILMRITSDMFGWNSFDEAAFRSTVDHITAVYPDQLIFHLKDGTERKTEWQLESRSKIWTPEMKAKAAENARRRGHGKKCD